MRTGLGQLVAYIGAIAFLVSGAWYGLAATGVIVDLQPAFSPGQTFDERLDLYYRWFATTFQQERFYTALSILGFFCLGSTVLHVRERFLSKEWGASLGAQAVGVGVLFWLVGAVEQLGGHQAVGRLVARPDALESIDSVSITVGKINDAFELASLLAIGVGMLLLAFAASRLDARWQLLTVAVGIVGVATAAAYALNAFGLVDVLLVVAGVGVMPVWLLASGRLLTRPA